MKPQFDLVKNDQDKLTLRRLGHEDMADVRLRRAFPWSRPERFVSIRSSEGKELLLVEDVSGLSAPLRGLIGEYLASSVFIPKITRIDAIDVRFGFQEWRVQTDRGPIDFRVQEREDIRFLPDGRYSVKDADGNVYELRSLAQLDEHSRRALEPLI
jgi:hypothetical protein